jgi:hypothetical protein
MLLERGSLVSGAGPRCTLQARAGWTRGLTPAPPPLLRRRPRYVGTRSLARAAAALGRAPVTCKKGPAPHTRRWGAHGPAQPRPSRGTSHASAPASSSHAAPDLAARGARAAAGARAPPPWGRFPSSLDLLQVRNEPRADERGDARTPERERAEPLREDLPGGVVADEVHERGGGRDEEVAEAAEEAGGAPGGERGGAGAEGCRGEREGVEEAGCNEGPGVRVKMPLGAPLGWALIRTRSAGLCEAERAALGSLVGDEAKQA